MAEYQGPIHLSREPVEAKIPAGVPGTYALGHARPHEGAVFVSFVGRADGDLRGAVLRHLNTHHTACFWRPAATPEEAYEDECALWHEMGGADLESADHPVPSGDFPCPVCD